MANFCQHVVKPLGSYMQVFTVLCVLLHVLFKLRKSDSKYFGCND